MGTPIAFDNLFNVRDLGGMTTRDGRTVRSGMLLRGDQLFSASDADLAKLRDMGVRKVIDFRSIGEHEEKPDPAMEDAENVFLPIIKDVGIGITRGTEGNMRIMDLFRSGRPIEPETIVRHMRGMYRSFVEDPFANGQYAQFVDEVLATAERGGATYWHCTAGKDRAGFATAVLLEALDVPREAIVADYLQTNEYMDGVMGQLVSLFSNQLPNAGTREALKCFFVADESYLESAFDSIEQRFGTVGAFLDERLGIDADKRRRLHGALLS